MNEMTLMANPSEVPRPSISLNDGPDSLLSMLPAKVQEMVATAIETRPELFDKSESDLFRFLRGEGAQPTPSDNRLRMKFWMEYDRCRLASQRKIVIDNVLAGICYREYFYTHYITNPMRLAWMMCMPTGYIAKTMETLEFGIERMRDILALDPNTYGSKGAVAVMALQSKITDMMHAWVKGAPVQRSLAVNVSASKQAELLSTEHSMEELEKRLKELHTRNKAAKNLPIDIQPGDLDD